MSSQLLTIPKVLGPRSGRFEDPAAFEGHSTPLQVRKYVSKWW